MGLESLSIIAFFSFNLIFVLYAHSSSWWYLHLSQYRITATFRNVSSAQVLWWVGVLTSIGTSALFVWLQRTCPCRPHPVHCSCAIKDHFQSSRSFLATFFLLLQLYFGKLQCKIMWHVHDIIRQCQSSLGRAAAWGHQQSLATHTTLCMAPPGEIRSPVLSATHLSKRSAPPCSSPLMPTHSSFLPRTLSSQTVENSSLVTSSVTEENCFYALLFSQTYGLSFPEGLRLFKNQKARMNCPFVLCFLLYSERQLIAENKCPS